MTDEAVVRPRDADALPTSAREDVAPEDVAREDVARAEFAESLIDALVDHILGAPRELRRDEVVAAVGVPLSDARVLWRALGFADVGDVVAFTAEDVEALRALDELRRDGRLDDSAALDLARSLGRTTSTLAEWQVDMFGRLLVEQGVVDPRDPLSTASIARLGSEVRALLPVVERLLVHAWRRQLAAAVERELGDAEAAAEDLETGVLTVGFADQVGFTRLARHLEEYDLAALVDRFESRAADLVAAGGGRLVKTLGDEVLFTFTDSAAAADTSLALLETRDRDDPSLRVGLATGTVVTRRGDVFGTTVNLASRLTAEARPGTVLIDVATAGLLGQRSGFSLSVLSPRPVRGLGTVTPVALARSATHRLDA